MSRRAVAFLGTTGMGKSTLAAFFALNGASFMTDDALIIDESDGVHALPGHASLRLWDDSVEALIPVGTARSASISYSDKARLLANDVLEHSNRQFPIAAAFVLGNKGADKVCIEALTGSDKQMAWIGNPFLLDIEDKDLLAQHFDWSHRISAKVPTFRLDYPREYGILESVQTAIFDVITGLQD